jgi:16S rRNA A1518/A1519 N6-dimethyltransferase RsmA/KsgA/DIM1 with predicted DNA glycosylase/AP lyase activity
MRRRRLGQHYLIDHMVVKKILEAASISPGERVLEIGTGRGELTGELVGLGKSFQGFEIDLDNYEKTRIVVGGKGRIVLGDAFEEEPHFDVLVASLPYSRSGEFIEWLGQRPYHRAVVLLQEDFVRKIRAGPSTREYRGVSALAQISSETTLIGRVGRNSFSPPPRVSSVIVRMIPKVRISKAECAKVKLLFSLRRRRVSGALADLGMQSERDYGIRRVFSLTPDEVHLICSSQSA